MPQPTRSASGAQRSHGSLEGVGAFSSHIASATTTIATKNVKSAQPTLRVLPKEPRLRECSRMSLDRMLSVRKIQPVARLFVFAALVGAASAVVSACGATTSRLDFRIYDP